MSKAASNGFRYAGVCRACGHKIVKVFPPNISSNDSEGKRIFCAECGTTNHITKGDAA